MDADMSIMVVDDFSTMRLIVKNSLKQLGFKNIVEAEDGRDALKKLKEDKVDFIFADWNMPNMTGIDLLRAVRSDDALKSTPFIMITAEAQKPNIMEAIEAGVNNYIVKPFSPDTLQEKMKSVLRTK